MNMGTRRTSAERLVDLEERRVQLAAEIASLSAREKLRARKDDDRRKVLLGSIVLADLATDSELAAFVRARLPSVMRPGDERLFTDLLHGDRS
jgi:hypothetical protein